MLEDRDYMRLPDDRLRFSWTLAILIANAIVFVVECVLLGYPPRFAENNLFALNIDGLRHGYAWQLLTYQFMHAGMLHIILNSWAIYLFGRAVEDTLGPRKFLTVYLISGILGGLFQALAAWAWPSYFGGPVVGASAAAFGLVAAYATLFPERELFLLIFFVLPVRLTARKLLIVSAILALIGFGLPFSNVANAAHLGGMLAGWLFIRWFVLDQNGAWRLPAFFSAPAASSPLRQRTPTRPEEELSTDEFVRKQVDPILDKISKQGIHSLTDRERQILEQARSKMAKR
jgi:membrane associated rhomboid family serine protease